MYALGWVLVYSLAPAEAAEAAEAAEGAEEAEEEARYPCREHVCMTDRRTFLRRGVHADSIHCHCPCPSCVRAIQAGPRLRYSDGCGSLIPSPTRFRAEPEPKR